ncbi:alpha/beta fold hydrolase [Emticicia agri]|uniref:Alpha/beta hydrolase n=1 Tax=Emticicia agri TaxID=2492393 RepID=A0A4Q5LVM0_9BACT|nr:alpha/beta hydrolase [Emticicia agri]RYU93557.1 alpha/beta hydrolase [Emticicia agri]
MNRTFSIISATLLTFFIFSCEKELSINEAGNLVPKTVEQDSSIPSIKVNSTQLHAETFGSPTDPMLVILHGGPGSDYRYLLNCKAFADQGYYVVFYDQRGSGLSKRHTKNTYSIQIMLDDLSGVIAHYKTSVTQKVFLLGHSWGAMLATAYINAYPKAINGAILAEPGGFIWQDVLDYVGRSRSFRFTSETLNDATYLDQFITGKQDEQAILDYKFSLMASADESAESSLGNDGPLSFWRSGAVIQEALFEVGNKEKPDWTNNLKSYTTLVLFIYSERNKSYGLTYAQKISSAYPNVQLEKINGAGHDMLSFPTGWNNFYPIALNYLNTL